MNANNKPEKKGNEPIKSPELTNDYATDGDEIKDLAYNEDEDSFELDIESEDEDYYHPDPYNTAVKNGSDFNSDYDEANREVNEEYQRSEADDKENVLSEEYGTHIDNGRITRLSALDEVLSHTDEDDREDLDEEGYPLNDGANEEDPKSPRK